MVLLALAGVATIAGIFWWYARDLDAVDESRMRNYRPPQVTRILSRDGEVIGEIYTERRTLVRYEDIPSHVENAFLAAEDADFYRHEGMDVLGMVRALVVNVRAGEVKQGASTITQQVVKIFLLSAERTLERKVQELVLARRVEQAFSKREIIELYLNEIYLGHGRYGIEEASRFYFGKSVRDIDLGQAALLATLPKAPGRDSPLQQPEHAKRRQVWVLGQMVDHGFATADEVAPFIDVPIDRMLAPAGARARIEPGAEEFVDQARAMLEAEFGADAVPYLGATVVTTVSLPLQRAARAAVREQLRAIDERQGYGHKLKPAKAKVRAQAQLAGATTIGVGQTHAAVVVAAEGLALPDDCVAATIGEHPVVVRVPAGSRYAEADHTAAVQLPVGAVVDVRIVAGPGHAEAGVPSSHAVAEIDAGPEAVVVVAAVDSGEVLAMIVGSRYASGGFDRASRALRQPGSSFKPFVYGAALASRQFTAASLVSDSPEIYEKWRPTNFEPDVYRGDIRLREALARSVNTVAIKLVDRLGVAQVQAFARAAGIHSKQPDDLSIGLGTGEVTPLELAGAYLTLARGGSRIDPSLVRSIATADGRRIEPGSAPQQVLGEDVAFVLTSMMTQVVQSGTGTEAKALGRPVAGKTGTSADHHDAWFAGFTPRTVAVAWIGFDRPRPLGRSETGGKAAVPLWVAAMRGAETGPALPFTPPPSVSVRRIDAATGLLAPPEAQGLDTLDEYFVPGTEPVDEAVGGGAKPTGDVLLGLYDDPSAPAPDTPAPQPTPPPAGGANTLPSVVDEP
ncbi:MAG: PBP1A family penicillin-binding protein [Nannocystaceae bacterium]